MDLRVGVIGCGNIATAMVRGWGVPVWCADIDAGRAQRLAAEVGGHAVASNAQLARETDLVVLCHKPGQLGDVAEEIATEVSAVISVLAMTPLSAVQDAYPGAQAFRVLPSVCAEVRRGPIVLAEAAPQPLDAKVRELVERLGTVIDLDDRLVDVGMGLMSTAPAYYALVVEAQVDAGVRRGLTPQVAAELACGSMAGTAELLGRNEFDTLRLRRQVTSPGGATARGLDALERAGMRSGWSAALDAVLD